MRFDLSQYETVQQRLDAFWERFPEGRIETVLVDYSGDRFIMQALIYSDAENANPMATGFAEEVIGSSPVNKTSAIENCETSAIGRALRNGSIGKNASREEMEKVERGEVKKKSAQLSYADAVAQLDTVTNIESLRALWKATSEDALNTSHTWIGEGDFELVATFKEYLTAFAKELGKK